LDITITLSTEQQSSFETIERTRKHLFFTGRAGTGKSVLLRYVREHTQKRVVVVAPTGIAALNVQGQTIHKFFKLPPKLYTPGSLKPNSSLSIILRNTDLLIIDEVSMLRADLLDAIDERCREACRNNVPFGGIQLVMFGDLFQLPPVVEEGLMEYFTDVHGGYFFFHAQVWKKTTFTIHELTQMFRQTDQEFRDILNAIRDGSVTEAQLAQLNERSNYPIPEEGVVTLAATNALVTEINQKRLDQLDGEMFQYEAKIEGEMKKTSFPTEPFLQLKKGAQVVLLKNDSHGRWVNGTVGIVAELAKDQIWVRVGNFVYTIEKETWEEIVYEYDFATRKVEMHVVSSFTQFPVRLAWCGTIHKSQGNTYDGVCIDLSSDTFAPGQFYVAASRCRTLDGLYFPHPVKRSHIITDSTVQAFMAGKESLCMEEEEEEAL